MVQVKEAQALEKTTIKFSVTHAVFFSPLIIISPFFRHTSALLFNFHLHLCDY